MRLAHELARIGCREKRNLLIIYSKIYSVFTFYRLCGISFFEPQITQMTLILRGLKLKCALRKNWHGLAVARKEIYS